MSDVASRIESVSDARYLAERRLPKSLFQMFEAGSGSDVTLRGNVQAFQEVMFRPRGAVFAPRRELARSVLGQSISLPVIVSPVGGLGLGHRDGEPGVARAAGKAGTIMVVSGACATPIEQIMAAASGPVFYQLYYFGGREASAAIIERVKRAGVSGLVITIDTAAPVRARDRPYRERRALPQGDGLREAIRFAPQALTKPGWLADFLRSGRQLPMAMRCARTERQ